MFVQNLYQVGVETTPQTRDRGLFSTPAQQNEQLTDSDSYKIRELGRVHDKDMY